MEASVLPQLTAWTQTCSLIFAQAYPSLVGTLVLSLLPEASPYTHLGPPSDKKLACPSASRVPSELGIARGPGTVVVWGRGNPGEADLGDSQWYQLPCEGQGGRHPDAPWSSPALTSSWSPYSVFLSELGDEMEHQTGLATTHGLVGRQREEGGLRLCCGMKGTHCPHV